MSQALIHLRSRGKHLLGGVYQLLVRDIAQMLGQTQR
jgi:hypothetical protein